MNTDTTQMKMPAGDGHPAAGNTDALNVADGRPVDKPDAYSAEPLGLYSRVVRRMPAEADVVERFRQAIEAAGLTPPEFIVADGQRRRFSSNGRRGDDAGWYVLYPDGVAAGAFGCWRLGISQTWSSKSESLMTAAEQAGYRVRQDEVKAQRDSEARERNTMAAEVAAKRWRTAANVESHAYLTGKGVQAHGIRIEGGQLLVPMLDAEGVLWSLQTINADGEKRFQVGGRVRGCHYLLGSIFDKLIICEGFATGASLYEATGLAVAVSFNAGNLLAVAQALRAKYPTVKIILAADDDAVTPGNPGLTKAQEAAISVGGYLAKPVTGSQGSDKVFCEGIDFNDLHRAAGPEAVRQCIDGALVCAKPAFAKPVSPDRTVILVSGADLKPEPVRWLWQNWLAMGKLHILAGAPGQGKTTIALTLAAAVTSGGRWPDGSRCPSGNVLIWSGEDDPADTLLPRLLAAGADRNRCYFVRGTEVGGEVQSFDPARDMAAMEQQAQVIGGIKLLVVDPVVSAVAGDGHKNNEVRRSLQPLVDLASRLGAAVVGISHFSKGGAGADPASRVVGSVAFTAVARVVLVAAKVKKEDGEERRILARSKSNIGPDDGGFEYQIEQSMPLPGIQASYVTWGQSVEGTARELLQDIDEQPKSEADDAVEMLRAELTAEVWTGADVASKPLLAAGFTKKQIWAASKKLGVLRQKGGMKGGWYWRLPKGRGEPASGPPAQDSIEDSEGSRPLDEESTGSSASQESSLSPESVLPPEDAEVF